MTRGYKNQCNAIAAGDLTALETAIERHPDSLSHWKPIVDAAHAGRADMVRALIAAGADPNVISGTGARHTPLTRLTEHHATIPRHDGHRKALVALLEGGADPNLRAGPHHFEPLAYAAMAPAQDFIDLLRSGGARIGVHLAASLLDNGRLVRALRNPDRAREVDPRGRTPLHYVALSGLWKLHDSDRALLCASLLLDAGADLDAAEEIVDGDEVFRATPLWHALAWQKHLALAAFLLERGADPNPAVFAVTYQGDESACALLDRYGADWEQVFNGRTPLMDLMYFRRPGASRWLIARGVDANTADRTGKTALHFAALRGVRADYVESLVDAGADVGAQDANGRTPLDYAVLKKRARLLEVLKPR